MVTLLDKTNHTKASGSYSTYQEPDTKIPPKARPLFDAVSVNGVAIAESEILAEAQNHPADNPGAALTAATRALVIRQLLLQEAQRTFPSGDIAAVEVDGRNETQEEAAIRALIERDVLTPTATDDECLRFYERNPGRFKSDTVYEACHILLSADPSDREARRAAQQTAEMLIAALEEHPGDFAMLAREYSSCPSRQHGGNLGQLTQGSTVREFELALGAMETGETSTKPVETRFGFHIIRLERRIDGQQLPFDLARERIAGWLEAATWSKAVSQYIGILAAQADITGIDLLADQLGTGQ